MKVDAIKYLYTFRGQFTKDQLLGALPLLARHLESTNYAVYTYAAICIERILFMRVSGATGPMMYVAPRLLHSSWLNMNDNVNVKSKRYTPNYFCDRFSSEDIAPLAETLTSNLFRLIELGQTPEKLAENDYLMKCKGNAQI